MSTTIVDHVLIADDPGLKSFFEENKDQEWLCFDTEFVGEKRFQTRLCLIQVATKKGIYLIDPFKIKALDPLLALFADPAILKITHAGENDYRLLNSLFGLVPTNVFDTQIAAAFAGYKFPVSFRKLVENELGIAMSKGYAVADWESRPFKEKQLNYALNDVIPLFDLWQSLSQKLQQSNRTQWAKEEFLKLEKAAYYIRDPHLEALNSNMMKALNRRERVFLIRLFQWRRELAKSKDYSKEMILPGKLVSQIVKSIHSGKDALRQNRRIPDRIANQYGNTFTQLYREPATKEELGILQRIPPEEPENPKLEILLEMLYLLVKYKCLESGMSPGLVFPKNALKKLRADPEALNGVLIGGWRKELLGENLVNWLGNIDDLELEINDNGGIKLSLRDKK